MKDIRSRDNPGWRRIVELAGSARERKRQGRSVLEGIHLCASYRQQVGAAETLVVSDSALALPEVLALLPTDHGESAAATAVWRVSDALFRELSQLEHGIGVACVVPTPVPALPPSIDEDCVFLDRLQDPGNVGTILRTCAAVGVRRVVLAPGSTGCWAPKVLRAGMGAHFGLVIHEGVSWSTLRDLTHLPAVATTADAPRLLYQTDLRAPRVWLFGNEGGGLAEEILDSPLERVAIPQQASVESLNVSSAVAICLYEQWRQRSAGR